MEGVTEILKKSLQILDLLYGFGQRVIEKVVPVLLRLLHGFGQGVIELLKKFAPVLLHVLYGFGRGVIEFSEKFVPALLHLLYDFCGYLTETQNRRTLILAIALSLLFICRCRGSRGGGGAAGKTMKAPGSGGRRMPRASFEGNPRAYFRNLRAGKQ